MLIYKNSQMLVSLKQFKNWAEELKNIIYDAGRKNLVKIRKSIIKLLIQRAKEPQLTESWLILCHKLVTRLFGTAI